MRFLHIQNWLRTKKAWCYTKLIGRDFGSIGKNSIIIPPFHSNDVIWIDVFRPSNRCKLDNVLH